MASAFLSRILASLHPAIATLPIGAFVLFSALEARPL